MDKRECGAYLFQGNSLVMPENGVDVLRFRGVDPETVRSVFRAAELFSFPGLQADAGGPLFAAALPPEAPLPPGWQAFPLRQWLSLVSADTAMYDPAGNGPALRAFHIAQWRANSRFCGRCGAENADAPDELARLCPACGRREYPRISPAVITLIVDGEDRALLAHNVKFQEGLYSLVAGFAEAGESLEGAVEREIAEEVGLAVTAVRYVRSQPWPFPDSLMLGFTCRHAGGEIRPDGNEITDAQWFSRGELPPLPGFGSVSRYLINLWIEGSL